MPSRLRLEVFEPSGHGGARLEMSESDLEETRLAAFENGYSAGWEDAVAAEVNEAARAQAELTHGLLDLSATFDEARSHILRAMEPLLRDMVSKVLPAIGRLTLAQMALEATLPLAVDLAEAPLTIAVHPDSLRAVQHLLADSAALKFDCVEEPSLSPGQVHLRQGPAETHIDIDGVILAIGTAIDDFFKAQKEAGNG